MEANDFSAAEYEPKTYPEGAENAVMYNGGRHRDHQNYGNPFQVSRFLCLPYDLADQTSVHQCSYWWFTAVSAADYQNHSGFVKPTCFLV